MIVLCLCAATAPGKSFNAGYTQDGLDGADSSVLLHLADDIPPGRAQAFFNEQNLAVVGYLSQIDVWRVVFSGSLRLQASELSARLAQMSEVRWAEINGLVHISEIVPDDPFYNAQQQNLRLIGLPQAWEITTGSEMPIAVVDTGLDMNHPDIEAKIWTNPGEVASNGLDDDNNGYVDDVHGWDFVNADADPQDDHSHGSHVAGIAAAISNNTIGIAGVTWGAQVMPLKALNQIGEGSWVDAAAAILYAADQGARVINLSFSAVNSSSTIEAAVQYAQVKGSLVIAAAGNGGGAVGYPAALPGVLAVAASDNNDLPWSLSNRGPEVDVSAPGLNIFSLNALGSYTHYDGTSMAAPHTSGLAALIWSMQPDLSAMEVAQVITTTAQDIWSPGKDDLTGWGRIDGYAALASLVTHVYLPLIEIPLPLVVYHQYLPMLVGNQP